MVTTRRLPPKAFAALRSVREPPIGGRPWAQRLRAVVRGGAALLWTFLAGAVQALLLVLPGRGKVVFARLFWAGVCRLLGLRVRIIGTPARSPGGRAVVFASNHTSWLDIPAP